MPKITASAPGTRSFPARLDSIEGDVSSIKDLMVRVYNSVSFLMCE
jgi:hypothetical protein